jgi:hypothetical protein
VVKAGTDVLLRVISKIFFVALLFGLSGCSTGKPSPEGAHPTIKRRVLTIYGNGVDRRYSQSAFRVARQRLEQESGVKLAVWDSIHMTHKKKGNPAPGKYLDGWKEFIETRVDTSKYDITFLFLPPNDALKFKGQKVSGFSEGIGIVGKTPGALAYTVVSGVKNFDAYVMLHELGHLLGGRHEDGGVMAAQANSLATGFTRGTVKIIRGEKPSGSRMFPFQSRR